MSKRNRHVWKVRTEDGRKREVRAQLFAKQWTLTSRFTDEEEWTEHPTPLLEDLEELYEVLERKYQRKHLAWEYLEGVRKLIEERKAQLRSHE